MERENERERKRERGRIGVRILKFQGIQRLNESLANLKCFRFRIQDSRLRIEG